MTKITVYPPAPVALNSPIQSLVIDEGDKVEWVYMSVGSLPPRGTQLRAESAKRLNYVYGYQVIKPVDLHKAGKEMAK